ncbi:MAG: response regulator, partial [Actinomycetota bacterium]
MHSEPLIRVGIADDHPIARQGVVTLISSTEDMTVAGEVADGESALALADRGEAPDVLMIDLRLPGIDGLETTRRLRETHAEVGTLILTASDDPHSVAAAVQAGAKAYVLKTAAVEQILETIRMVARGHVVFDSAVWETLSAGGDAPATEEISLSPRTKEVLILLSWGLGNREIAAELGLSIETVKTHIERLYKRLGVTTRTGAVAKVL